MAVAVAEEHEAARGGEERDGAMLKHNLSRDSRLQVREAAQLPLRQTFRLIAAFYWISNPAPIL